jgi:hypothetical protein
MQAVRQTPEARQVGQTGINRAPAATQHEKALAARQAGRMFRNSAFNPSGSADECCAALVTVKG